MLYFDPCKAFPFTTRASKDLCIRASIKSHVRERANRKWQKSKIGAISNRQSYESTKCSSTKKYTALYNISIQIFCRCSYSVWFLQNFSPYFDSKLSERFTLEDFQNMNHRMPNNTNEQPISQILVAPPRQSKQTMNIVDLQKLENYF